MKGGLVMMLVREASLEDIEGIARVHVDSWRSTYKGIISESYLSNLTLEKRKKNWLWTFNNLNKDERIFVAEVEGRIVGYGATRCQDSFLKFLRCEMLHKVFLRCLE
jgi:hypothetical protein